VIADQSVNYVERFIIDEGHTAQRVEKDYGYDLILFTYDEQGYIEPGLALLQLKASEMLERSGKAYVFDLDIRDYNLWILERSPVFLVLFDASRRRAWWLHVQDYFRDESTRPSSKGVKSVRVRVPPQRVLTRRVIARLRRIKQESTLRLRKGTEHD
jgi:hypothetical protein